MAQEMLRIEGLRTIFFTNRGMVAAVDGVDLSLDRGGTLGVVGESGSGKTVCAYSILRLIPYPGRVVGGSIRFDGENLLALSSAEMRKIRGNRISMIFQEPMTSLNPVLTVGRQIMEPLIFHQGMTRARAWEESVRLLGLVGIPSAEHRIREYPHQLSGGMRQRVMIAMALSCRPSMLIADEPTTALDVTIQAQILDLMKRLQSELGMAIMLITHNLGVVAQMVERVAVMYAGQVVEYGPTSPVYDEPRHPYTAGLLGSIPKLHERRERLQSIAGTVPSMLEMPSGCRFRERCLQAMDRCQAQPPVMEVGPGHTVRCWLAVNG
jgi:peptide/nickel transport system ATP-binding protein/oligopeptide transport system ATP-binding protein